MSIFDVFVSFYKNVFDKAPDPPRILLSKFLKSRKKNHVLALSKAREFYAKITAPEGTQQHKNQKEKYRQIKTNLPACTIAGVTRFTPDSGTGKKVCEMVQYSGFMQLDIDGKDNPDFTVDELFQALTTLPHAAYVGRSVSGEGLFVLLRISEPENYALHYTAALEGLKPFGIKIDPDANSPFQLRLISPDPDAYYNESAPIFTHKATPSPAPAPKPKPKNQRFNPDKADPALICIDYIQKHKIDVTQGRTTWLRIGSALYFEYGSQQGREYFHTVGQFHPDYTEAGTDSAFDAIQRHRKETSINYFLKVCKSSGISVKDILQDKAKAIEQKRKTTFQKSDKSSLPTVNKAKYHPPTIHQPPPEGLHVDEETGEILNDPHPNGFNPYTGEIFDMRGYPASWDMIEPPEPDTPEYREMIQAENSDSDRPELDPKLSKITQLFDAVPI